MTINLKIKKYQNILKQKGYNNEMSFQMEAFSRNIRLLTLAEQEKLRLSKIAIPGMGGVGGVHLTTLLRTGVGQFHISDLDEFELANMNRQYGSKIKNLDQPKVDSMVEEAAEINPFANITTFPKGISEDNIDDFLDGVDIVVDGMDAFNIYIRRLIFNKAHEKGIPVITAGPIGFSAATLIFMPGRGLSFDEYFDIRDEMDEEEQLLRFFIGLMPKATHLKYVEIDENLLKSRRGPSLGLACQQCAATAATEVIRIILGKKGIKAAPHYFQYDLLTRNFVKGYMPLGNKNPLQKLKLKISLKRLANMKPKIGPEKIIPPLLSSTISDEIPEEIINYLLKAGQQAPSGENIQPWKLKNKKNVIYIQLNTEADHSLFNLNQTASTIACGAAAENINIATSKYNLNAAVKIKPSLDKEGLLAEINLKPTQTNEDPLARFIWERHTNRTKYNQKPIPEKDLDSIRRACSQINGASLDLFTDKNDLDLISKMVFKADIFRMETRSLHEMLMSHIHFSDEAALATRDGFHLKNLEAGFDGEIFLKLIRPWVMANAMNKIGMAKVAAGVSKKGVKQASAMGLIRIKGNDSRSFFEGGRAMQRLWLEATRLGISYQPITILTFLRRYWTLDKTEIFTPEHKKLFESVWTDYEQVFNCNDQESHIMLFRLGYGSKVKVGTLRKKP
jgi:molybdopterin/thiamine biosynthesis adenylyltransferase